MNKEALRTYAIKFGDKKIEFSLTRSDRKSLGIQVHPDKSVIVIAPANAPLEKIEKRVRGKAPWILAQQAFFHSFDPLTPPRKFVSGETHLYLGRQYRLKIHLQKKKEVKLKGGFLHVWTPIPDKKVVQHLVESWYRARANTHFMRRVQAVRPRFVGYDLPTFEITIRKMKKRWGSCSPNGRITLNLELIKASIGCIDYVIVHELCHLIFPNHTGNFYQLQKAMMPDWKKWKEQLERTLA